MEHPVNKKGFAQICIVVKDIELAAKKWAELLGMDSEIGSIAEGKRANLLIIDDAVNIKKVILDGKDAVENGEIILKGE